MNFYRVTIVSQDVTETLVCPFEDVEQAVNHLLGKVDRWDYVNVEVSRVGALFSAND